MELDITLVLVHNEGICEAVPSVAFWTHKMPTTKNMSSFPALPHLLDPPRADPLTSFFGCRLFIYGEGTQRLRA